MSRWFRHYAGMMRDDKLVGAAIRSKQSVERVVWVWGAILESAGEINDGGKFEFDAAEVAYFLRADEADISAILSALTNAGRVAEGVVVNWGARQFQSDTSATRQAAYRERKRSRDGQCDVPETGNDGEVTAVSRHGDAPETETEANTDKKDIRAVADAPRPRTKIERWDEFKRSYPKRKGANPWKPAFESYERHVRNGTTEQTLIDGAKSLERQCRADGQIGTQFVPQAVTWLRQQRWGDDTPDEAETPLQGFYAKFESAEQDAWDAYGKAKSGKTFPRDKNGGWRFPTQWPPGYVWELYT